MEKNPFLEEEETYETHKPRQERELTEAQKKRNFKGLELVKETLKKLGANIRDYKKGVN